MVLPPAEPSAKLTDDGHWNMPAEPPSVSLREPAPDILCDVHMLPLDEQPTGLLIQREHHHIWSNYPSGAEMLPLL